MYISKMLCRRSAAMCFAKLEFEDPYPMAKFQSKLNQTLIQNRFQCAQFAWC